MDHDVAVRVVGLVRGPFDVRIVPSQAVTAQRTRHADPMKHVDSSALTAILVPGRFRMNVRAVISRNATSRQSACANPLTMGSIRCRIVSGDTNGLA